MSSDFITVTRSLVKRGWSDFEPKVIAGLLSGSVAAFAISLLGQYGIHLTAIQQNYIVVGFYFLGSYMTPSAGTTVTTNHNTSTGTNVQQSETHSGNAVSVVTSPTLIQPPAEPVAGKYDAFLAGLSSNRRVTDEQPTTVIDR